MVNRPNKLTVILRAGQTDVSQPRSRGTRLVNLISKRSASISRARSAQVHQRRNAGCYLLVISY